MRALEALGSAIQEREEAALWGQIFYAMNGISLALPLLNLTQEYMKIIQLDSLYFSQDTYASVYPDDKYSPDGDPHKGQGPHMAIVAARDNMQKDLDQQASDQATSALNNLLGTIKSMATYLGQTLENVFQLETPMLKFLEEAVASIGAV